MPVHGHWCGVSAGLLHHFQLPAPAQPTESVRQVPVVFILFSILSIWFRQNVQGKYRIARSYNDTASKKYACSRNLCCFLIGLTSTGITRYQSPKKSRIASIICCYTYIPRRKSNLRPLLIYLYTYCIYFFNRGFQSAEDCRKKQESYCPGNNYYIKKN